MARVTVEDCVEKVENRFELVLLASHRARQISQGASLSIERNNDKNPVVALREIAEETFSPADLKEDLIHSLQKYVEIDEPEVIAEFISSGKEGMENIDSGNDEQDDLTFDQMSEEALLSGIEALVAPEEREED